MEVLLQVDPAVYDNRCAKQELLQQYLQSVVHQVSGGRITADVSRLAENLRRKAVWMQEHIRKTEWIQGDQEGWFNSYYDNHGNAVEGCFTDGVRMMLTGRQNRSVKAPIIIYMMRKPAATA